jgi:hypothetical protein
VSGACCKHEGDEKFLKIFNRTPRKKNNLRDLDVYGKIILKWALKEYGRMLLAEFNRMKMESGGGIM